MQIRPVASICQRSFHSRGPWAGTWRISISSPLDESQFLTSWTGNGRTISSFVCIEWQNASHFYRIKQVIRVKLESSRPSRGMNYGYTSSQRISYSIARQFISVWMSLLRSTFPTSVSDLHVVTRRVLCFSTKRELLSSRAAPCPLDCWTLYLE